MISGNNYHVITSFLFSTLDDLNRQTSTQTNIVYKFECCSVPLIGTWKVAKLCTLGGPNMHGNIVVRSFLQSILTT